ncbi:MAG TPA: OmpH family outer membrane protein [bacterium]|nr:OmpH family outer membrane protein [bacterium]HOL95279.1 OmpH family outer membrane protein [bacterium]
MRISRFPVLYAGCWAAVAVLLAAPAGWTQTTTVKLGFVDLQRIHSEWAEYKKISDELKSLYTAKMQELRKKSQSIQKEWEGFELQKELLPPDSAKQQEDTLKLEASNFRQQLETEAQKWEQEREKRLEPLVQKLKTTIETIAKEEKYSFIFSRSYLFYVDPKFDITDKVLTRVNKK